MSSAIVIGGGILGVSTAWRLAEQGVQVTLLEAGALGGGASRASFAWLNASNKPPQAYHQLNVDGMNEYHRIARELTSSPWLHFNGQIEWDGAEGGAGRIREKVTRLRNWGYTAELLPISELRALEPELIAPNGIEEFAYFPHEGYIDPVEMIGAFAARATSSGATIKTNTAVTELIVERGRVTGVVTRQGDRLAADTVVDCVGSVAPELLGKLGLTLPMAPTTGMVAVSSPSATQLNCLHHDEGINIRPDGAGRIMMRHYDFDDMVSPETPELPIPSFMDQLLARVAAVLPSLASARIDAIRITTRPIPGDGHSAVGSVPGVEGLYLIVTHSGVTLGPLLARIAAREITSGQPDCRLDDFRPARLIGA